MDGSRIDERDEPAAAYADEPPRHNDHVAADGPVRTRVPAAVGRRPSRGVSPWLVLLLLVVIAGLLFRLGWLTGGPLFDPHAEPRPVTPRGELATVERDAVELFRKVSPSVVNVIARAEEDPLRPGPLGGAGSGFVWDDRGHVVTNDHVVRNAVAWTVTLADGSTWDARLVGTYPERDIAVLKVGAPPSSLVPIMIGTSEDLAVGQQAFAIGSPFGLDQTFTAGVISGLGREIRSEPVRDPGGRFRETRLTDVIQTDASINPGNSGGPLLDSAGRLIGMNTAIYSKSGTSDGVGFAVPVDDVNRFVPDLIRDGTVERVGIGVQLEADYNVARLFARGVLPRRGALVAAVLPGGAADRAGLRGYRDRGVTGGPPAGDLIVGLDGEPVESYADLADRLTRRSVGDEVEITALRDGEERTTTVELQVLPEG